MATPVITFSNASGTDSAASGAGPAVALSGTSASFSGSVFTLDGSPDLSGVATDGSHVIWVQTSTGRQFFTINAVDDGADTVTVDDAPAGTASGLTWGLGGKRKTIDNAQSRTLWTDSKYGWIAEMEDDQVLTSQLLWSAPLILQSNDDTIRTLDQSGSNTEVCRSTASTITLKNLKLTCSGTTSTNSRGVYSIRLVAQGCVFGDATNQLQDGLYNTSGTLIDCEIKDCVSRGLYNTSATIILTGCTIHDNGSDGIYCNSGVIALAYSDVYDNAGYGVRARASDRVYVEGSNIHSNGNNGIAFNIVGASSSSATVVNSNITANTGYGILFPASQDVLWAGCIANNNFGTGATANSSGMSSDDTILNVIGSNIEVDPQFTDSANGNFTPNGDNTAQLGFPQGAYGQRLSESYLDIGTQRFSSGGGGSVYSLHPLAYN